MGCFKSETTHVDIKHRAQKGETLPGKFRVNMLTQVFFGRDMNNNCKETIKWARILINF